MLKRSAIKESQALITLCLTTPLLFFLAQGPQNPDGAELVTVAMRGGVPHSLGFPILCWMNRFLLSFFSGVLPQIKAATILSAASWLFHATAIYFFMKNLRLVGATFTIQIISGFLCCYLPVLCGMGLQPEKYAYLFFIMNLFLYSSFQILSHLPLSHPPPFRFFLLLGISLGMGFSHHETTVGLAFSGLVIPILLIKRKRLNFKNTLGTLLPALFIPLGAFATLPWLRGPYAWVDWGNLKTAQDIVSFIFVKNYGHTHDLFSFSLLKRMNLDILHLLYLHLFEVFSFSLFPLVFLGAHSLYKNKKYELLLLSLYFLAMALICSTIKLDAGLASLSYLERYILFPLLPVLILIFMGMGEIWERVRHRSSLRKMVSLLFIVFGSWYLGNTYQIHGFMDEDIMNLYRKGLSREMEPDSFFVSREDWVLFYGIPQKGELLFPLYSYFPLPWYRFHVAPRLEPRIKTLYKIVHQRDSWSFLDLIEEAFKQGYPVASTNLDLIQHLGPYVEKRGFLWVARKGMLGAPNKKAALRICQDLSHVSHPVPLQGNFSKKYLLIQTGDVFWDLSKIYFKEKNFPAAKIAGELANSLRPGISPMIWRQHCQKLVGGHFTL